MTATTDRCPGCHGSGIEMSGVTYAGMSEYVGCHECGPECPDDCGCRASDATERPESIAPRHPGATQSPDGSQGATEGLRGAESAVTDAEAARWGVLADAATEGPWRVSGRTVLGEGYGAEFVGIPDTPADAAFVAKSREIVPRLLADRERLTAEREALWADHAALLALHEVEVARRESFEARVTRLTADLDAMEAEDSREDVRAKHWTEVLRVRRELAGVRGENNDAMEVIARGLGYSSSDFPLYRWPHLAMTGDHTSVSLAEEVVGRLGQARDFAARVEAENARLRAGIEALAAEWHQAYDPDPIVLTNRMRAADLRALLAEGGE